MLQGSLLIGRQLNSHNHFRDSETWCW